MRRLNVPAAVVICAIVAVCWSGISGRVLAQTEPTVSIKFKVFDTNKPAVAVKPADQALIYVRDPATLKPTFQKAVAIKQLPDDFYEVKVSKGWLIEQLVIEINDARKDYNPAIVTKIVSSADMVIYPGASQSKDDFSFPAYIAQMSAYKAVLSQILDDERFDPGTKKDARIVLRNAFRVRLRDMTDALPKRLLTHDKAQLEVARKLLEEVLGLYGIPFSQRPIPVVSSCWEPFCNNDKPAAALVSITVPDNTKLFFDDHLTQMQGPVRQFTTPPLPLGIDFHYSLKAQIVTDGKTVVESLQITVQAGHITKVHFDDTLLNNSR